MLVTAGCAVVMLAGGAPAAFAQRGGGGHGGGGGGHGGGTGGFRGGTIGRGPGPAVGTRGVGPAGRPGSMMGPGGFNRGGFNNFNRGGFNRGNFHNDFNRGNFDRGDAFAHGRGFVNNGHFYNGHFHDFRPAVGLGFGLWAGSPWAWGYPYYGYYLNSYPYYSDSYPYVNSDDSAPYTDTSGVDVQLGGVIFDVNPSSAELFVDGNLVGRVSEFTPTTQQPLELAPGHHHVEIRAAGYHTASFDADITAGQVMPYQGTLERE
jgi:hypothetical protein